MNISYILLCECISLPENFQCVHVSGVLLAHNLHLAKVSAANYILHFKIIRVDPQVLQVTDCGGI